jgi:hypothetical protein
VDSSDFELIFAALQKEQVRYLVVGGVAVVLHGHPRFTADLDLVIALDRENVLAAVRALERLGYRPRAPVPAAQLADAHIRGEWIRDKGLAVFSLWSSEHPATEVDIFVEEPFDFDAVFARAVRAELGAVAVSLIGVADLIAMKRRVGRPKDLEDIRVLQALIEEGPHG